MYGQIGIIISVSYLPPIAKRPEKLSIDSGTHLAQLQTEMLKNSLFTVEALAIINNLPFDALYTLACILKN